MGFVFIEANVKKWGLAPMTGSLAPPPPYGSEQGSILLEGGQSGVREGQAYLHMGHGRSASGQIRPGRPPHSPGPQRSPTEISLAQLSFISSRADDIGEGTSTSAGDTSVQQSGEHGQQQIQLPDNLGISLVPAEQPPPEYESPEEEYDEAFATPRASMHSESRPFLQHDPPIPSYEAAVADSERRRDEQEDES